MTNRLDSSQGPASCTQKETAGQRKAEQLRVSQNTLVTVECSAPSRWTSQSLFIGHTGQSRSSSELDFFDPQLLLTESISQITAKKSLDK